MKKKVVIILNRLVIGGQAVDTIPLAYYLQQDFDIVVLFGEKEKDELEASFLLTQYNGLQIKKIKHLRRTINPIVDMLAFFSIIKEIKKYKAHIVHTHGSKSGLLGRLAAKLLGTPVILHTFHGHLFHSYFSSFGNRLIKWVERSLASISTGIIALSKEQEKELTEKFNIVPSKKITVIPLGVDDRLLQSKATSSRSNFRQQLGIPDDAVVIGSVGRIVPIKNLVFLLQIAKAILNSNLGSIYFVVVGDGESKPAMVDYLIANNIPFSNVGKPANGNKVIFTSWVEDMATVYHGLDILLLTSLNEGTPLSIIEAQFCGKPVVASNVGGVKDTFQPNVSGLLIDGHTEEDYVQALRQLIISTVLRKEMGVAAIQFATNTFAKTQEVAAVKELYLQQLAQTKQQ